MVCARTNEILYIMYEQRSLRSHGVPYPQILSRNSPRRRTIYHNIENI